MKLIILVAVIIGTAANATAQRMSKATVHEKASEVFSEKHISSDSEKSDSLLTVVPGEAQSENPWEEVKARVYSNYIKVDWKAIPEGEGGTYIIERSENGSQSFERLGTINAMKQTNYSFVDYRPFNGNNNYRIVFRGKNDENVIYSENALADFNARNALKASATYGRITARVDLSQKGSYNLAIVNSSGQAVYKEELKYDGSRNSFDLQLNNTLPLGIYSVMIFGNGINLSCQILIK